MMLLIKFTHKVLTENFTPGLVSVTYKEVVSILCEAVFSVSAARLEKHKHNPFFTNNYSNVEYSTLLSPEIKQRQGSITDSFSGFFF